MIQDLLKEKFLRNTYIDPDLTDCWLWLACKTAKGYGRLRFQGKTEYAHRVSYAIFSGRGPGKMLVLHSCDNGLCVNPAHLRLGTHQDNSNDMLKRNRQATDGSPGETHPRAGITNCQTMEIVEYLRSTNMTHYEIAKLFSVTYYVVSNINTGKSWAFLTNASKSNPVRRGRGGA